MILIDENLKNLALSQSVCERNDLVEDFCIQIRLSNECYFRPKSNGVKIVYGVNSDGMHEAYDMVDPQKEPMFLKPQERVLACSQETYNIPNNIFGLVQTKGTLARLFVQVTCCDGQIEPGFNGKITLEIVNLSPFDIEIPCLSKVAQLYLFQCSMKSAKPYAGKYARSDIPTLPDFDGF
ncbi:dCTP deaminase [Enterobacter asburiae]|jgi:deoxycytidine triphosphate deaminase|uniref:dCTP deaminase n=1 Tax=Enterobacter asburiae TaxID=61645 RepID=UPI002B7E21AE|nr:hypothetical protein [Enterobacter asburiae]